jgi:hypothetical protein
MAEPTTSRCARLGSVRVIEARQVASSASGGIASAEYLHTRGLFKVVDFCVSQFALVQFLGKDGEPFTFTVGVLRVGLSGRYVVPGHGCSAAVRGGGTGGVGPSHLDSVR